MLDDDERECRWCKTKCMYLVHTKWGTMCQNCADDGASYEYDRHKDEELMRELDAEQRR